MIDNNKHITVLLDEAVSGLNIKPDGIYVDGTFGRGGHSRLILSKLNSQGRLIAIDRDLLAIEEGKKIEDPRFEIFHDRFSNVEEIVEKLQLKGKISGFLLDLGVSSPQIDDPSRGFSFMKNGPLDMRMDTSSGMTAAEWINTADEGDLSWVFKEFGEERFAKKIARSIVIYREKEKFSTTKQLADLIARESPTHDKHKHPATRCFQAIRIYVNSELTEISKALNAAKNILEHNGRLSVISFHSLEDRIVKQFMKKESSGPEIPSGLPILEEEIKKNIVFKIIGKAIKPTEKEIEQNVRSRSAILRIAEKI